MKPTKIGITCYPTVGGSGVVATELAKLLAEKGYEIHFITSSVPFRLKRIYPNIYYHEVEMSHYAVFQYPPYDLALANKMAEVINREKIDILHVHYAMPHAICAILAKQMVKHDVKIVTTLHGTDITVLAEDASFTDMIRFGIEQSDKVTAVSRSLVKQTKEMLHTDKDIEVIYNFVDEREYKPKEKTSLKAQYGIKDEEKVVIHISNFRKVKRISDIVTSFAKMLPFTNAKLLLVGDGPEYSQACQLVTQLDIRERVLFLGKQENVAELLSIADLKLLLSEKESFGLVLLEAMACGVPCIGTNTGGIPEVIIDGETGYISEVGDVESVASLGVELLMNRAKWERFSRNSLARVAQNFHSAHIVKQYERIYADLLEDKG
ncbi:N-acetyl-alpha-D-glucosaminyl L-malate synthase BshA [Pontibacillus litoralis]|uniref:N-acetyl-alpha-D-glucosaminyl L-malate synthase n=1 Tax=Pontibacillus litoralis JSM 072002 TaxID=1385512 RepID=A0A0A5G9Z8_9BACI|nr:N-acetyl-alpha-D-glucosaminyl L-malate synthase BshA [Pontibacillus litoralis]KGX87945.1 N-acetyl-alpha-D-glucosaminyl L-malate synthase [Pontibacillus litoralis JSM 072002]